MALTAQQREDAWVWLMQNRAPAGTDTACRWTQDELRTAMDAATTWIEANQASFVAALSSTAFAGASSTADEKIRLFVAALVHKFGVVV